MACSEIPVSSLSLAGWSYRHTQRRAASWLFIAKPGHRGAGSSPPPPTHGAQRLLVAQHQPDSLASLALRCSTLACWVDLIPFYVGSGGGGEFVIRPSNPLMLRACLGEQQGPAYYPFDSDEGLEGVALHKSTSIHTCALLFSPLFFLSNPTVFPF